MSNNTYKLYALGCKVNQYDSGKLGSFLSTAGLKKVEEDAEYAIVYTCSVTSKAITKNRRMITKAKKENPSAKIVLAGCWPRVEKVNPDKLGVDFVLSTEDHEELEAFLFGRRIALGGGHKSNLSSQNRSRYFIKVQDGCEQFCSYCIIPYTRGKLKSREREDVLSEIKKAIQKGYGEIVLSGIHLGLFGYGTDYRLVDLIKDILKIEGLGRIRLSSIEVNEVSDELVELIKKEKKICNHLHIPLQSGSDKILKSMNRPYTTADFRMRISRLRKAVPLIAITTDIIVGFPGETDKDFKETYDFVEQMKFSKLHVFVFTAHAKTPAFNMPDQVDSLDIRDRAARLRTLGYQLEKRYREKFKDMDLEVVLESLEDEQARLKTEYFFDVYTDASRFRKSDIGKIF